MIQIFGTQPITFDTIHMLIHQCRDNGIIAGSFFDACFNEFTLRLKVKAVMKDNKIVFLQEGPISCQKSELDANPLPSHSH